MSSGGNQAGWREDPQRPGIQRYWFGKGWADDIPPRPSPEPIWRAAAPTALGVLVAFAAIFLLQSLF